jgi:hypothetical protein
LGRRELDSAGGVEKKRRRKMGNSKKETVESRLLAFALNAKLNTKNGFHYSG